MNNKIYIYFGILFLILIPNVSAINVIFNASNYGGEFRAFRNGELLGDAYYGHNATVNYSIGDIISFVATPYNGYSVLSVCDVPYTECQTATTYVYEVVGALPNAMIVTYNLTPTGMPIIFNASNYGGEFRAFRNGELIVDAYYGHNMTGYFNLGDILSMVVTPYDGYSVLSVCDVPYTECQTTTTYVYEVVGALPNAMIVTYKNAPTTYMNVVFNVSGQGQLLVFRDGDLVASASKGYNATGNFRIGNIISIIAQPDHNNSLISLCDVPYTECINTSNNVFEVVGTLPNAMIATFTNNNLETGLTSKPIFGHNTYNWTLPDWINNLLSSTGFSQNVDGLIAFSNTYVTYYIIFGFITFMYMFMKRGV
jgi:hypothetical protein